SHYMYCLDVLAELHDRVQPLEIIRFARARMSTAYEFVDRICRSDSFVCDVLRGFDRIRVPAQLTSILKANFRFWPISFIHSFVELRETPSARSIPDCSKNSSQNQNLPVATS